MVAFKPGGDVGEQGKAGGVRFGKAIDPKALDLFKQALGKIQRIASRHHAVGEFLFKLGQGGVVARAGSDFSQNWPWRDATDLPDRH